MEDSTEPAPKRIVVEVPRHRRRHHRARTRGGVVQRLFSSWAVRAGLLLFIGQCIYVPWRQAGFIGSEGIPVPPRAVGYSFLWNPPYQASVDLVRLFLGMLMLAAAIGLGYLFERSRERR